MAAIATGEVKLTPSPEEFHIQNVFLHTHFEWLQVPWASHQHFVYLVHHFDVIPVHGLIDSERIVHMVIVTHV